MFFLFCVIIVLCRGELFCNSLDWVPICRAKIGTKCEATLQEEYCVDHKGEGSSDIGVVL